MEKVLNSYESLFIVDVTAGDEAVEATVGKFMSLIEANAEVIDVAKWGKRRLAYPINDKPEGYYVVATFKSEPDFPAELTRLLNIDESIMRSVTVKLEYDAAVRKAAKASAAAAAEAAAKAAAEAAAQADVAEEAPEAEVVAPATED